VYLRWVARLHRRGDTWPVGRTVSWVLGVVVLVWTGNGGPAMYGHVLFSAHMVQHMILAMVIPIFLVLGAPVTLAMRALPPRHDGSRGPREWILTIVHSRYGQFFAHPVVAAVNFAGSMIVFYYSPAFELALRTYAGHLAMTIHFLLAGYFFANALIGVDPGPKRIGYPQRLLLLFATMAAHAFFGVALTTGSGCSAASGGPRRSRTSSAGARWPGASGRSRCSRSRCSWRSPGRARTSARRGVGTARSSARGTSSSRSTTRCSSGSRAGSAERPVSPRSPGL
jgi:hypothetical protein